MRLNINKCSNCIDICPKNAISISESVQIDSTKCTQCGLCNRVCPTNAIHFIFPFNKFITTTKETVNPVIGCSFNSVVKSNLKIHCIGSITPDILLFINTFSNKKIVQFNCSACRECKNNFSLDYFNNSIDNFFEKTNYLFENIKIISNDNELVFQDDNVGRRNFFKQFVQTALTTKEYLSQDISHISRKDFHKKFLPLNREMLNLSLNHLSEKKQECLKKYFYNDLPLKNNSLLSKVSAFCPTGAIAKSEESGNNDYQFADVKCVRCNLCADAAMPQADYLRR